MRIVCRPLAALALVVASAPLWSQEGQGLDPSGSGWFAGQWQARIELNHGVAHSSFPDPYSIAAPTHGLQRPGLSVLGDFFFKSPLTDTPAATLSGFRATSGLMVGPRQFGPAVAPAAFSDSRNGDAGPVPYFGVGYTDLPSHTGWGFSADFGWMAMSPRSAVRFGNTLGSPLSIDDLLRDLRLSPLIQIGVSYSF